MPNHQFVMNKSGLSGIITYHEGVNSIDIYWEISGSTDHDIVFCPIDLREWDNPKGTKISTEHQLEILRNLRVWLNNQNIKSNIDLPLEVTITDQQCMWANCSERKIKGSAYCLYHYDLNLLFEGCN